MKKMKLKAILIDIDETIVSTRVGNINYFNDVLAELISKRDDIEIEDALVKIASLQKRCIRGDAFFVAAHLGFSMDEVFHKSLEWMAENEFKTYPDAVAFIHQAHAMGFRLFTLTNNGVMGVLTKLLPSGLADRNGKSFFEKFYGDDSLGDNKANSEVYKRFLEKENFSGEEVLMVGDNYQQDGVNALVGGVKNIAIVDRKQTEKIRQDNEMLIINNLENLIPLIEKDVSI